ncbi:MAG TPA: type II toxin-antitoxin system prevent-host-death family antitoxin [Candidatus Udaeobacter sp.]|jgi:prevent-host-death family protein|nr:type II toxin-antitoxin system prevent-host-death family antitoxin [Candidatus Udaeobacter sp.]
MTTTLREAKARLSEMVKRASRGEEVVITVHGKETAKLVPVPKRGKRFDKEKWLKELDKLRKKNWRGRYGRSIEEILEEDRADRFS